MGKKPSKWMDSPPPPLLSSLASGAEDVKQDENLYQPPQASEMAKFSRNRHSMYSLSVNLSVPKSLRATRTLPAQ